MRIFIASLTLVMAMGCASSPPALDVAPVVQAERAFAADAAQRGWVEAFETWSAADALVVRDGPGSAREMLARINPANRGDTSLTWAPEFAGLSRDAAFGFTTGPYSGGRSFGHYFTVWRKQSDGSWRWIFDGGTETQSPTVVDAEAEVSALPVGVGGAGSAEAAVAAVRLQEQRLAARAQESAAQGLGEVFAGFGWMNRQNQPTAIGREAATAMAGAGGVRYAQPEVIEASAAGDMVFTLGEARWSGGAGYYCRIWVLQAEGWKVGYDQIMPRPLEGN